jgi:hypothetical protein
MSAAGIQIFQRMASFSAGFDGKVCRVQCNLSVEGHLDAEIVSTTPESMYQFNRAQIAVRAKVGKASGARTE